MWTDLRKTIEYKYWAFRMLVYAIVLLFIVFNRSGPGAVMANIIAHACLLAGIPFVVVSYVKKEKQDMVYTIAFIGIAALNLWSFVLPFLAAFT